MVHLGNPKILDHQSLARCFEAAHKRTVSILYLGYWGTHAYGWWGWLQEYLFGRPQLVSRDKAKLFVSGNWVHDLSEGDSLLGSFSWTPHGVATQSTLDWYSTFGWV